MPTFYRGAGVGTYWHMNDARINGFTPQVPGMSPSIDRLKNHIARGTSASPYVSLTRSYGVALSYAIYGSRTLASQNNPGYVYEIDLSDPLPVGLQLLDPVVEIARSVPEPTFSISYQHDGLPNFLLGIVNPRRMGRYLKVPYPQPPGSMGTNRPPNLTIELEAFVRALRDAEILAVGNIPAAGVTNRHSVF